MDEFVKEIHDFLVSEGFERSFSGTERYSYEGKISAAGKPVSILITFPDGEFLSPPKIKLLNRAEELPTAFAHLDGEDGLCYLQAETVLLDRYNPAGTILACLNQARKTIEEIVSNPQNGLELEIVQLWRGIPVLTLFEPTFSGSCKFVVINEPEINFWLGPKQKLEKILPQSAVKDDPDAFVFSTSKNVFINAHHHLPTNFSEFINWAQQFVPDIVEKLSSIVRRTYPHPPKLFINGPNGCIGILPSLPQNMQQALQRPEGLLQFLLKQGDRISVTRAGSMRADWDYIISRNLYGRQNLVGARIALIGCGTIGSHLAKFLVQCGAGSGSNGKLLLIDEQFLSPGNIGRHLLSVQYMGRKKSAGLEEELKRLYPMVAVTHVSKNALAIQSDLSHYDLIIDATGEEAFSTSLNHHAVYKWEHEEKFPPVIFSYLLGNGDAAQTLYVDGERKYACYKCLRPSNSGERKQSPMRNHAQFNHIILPCGESPFIAYGVGAPVMAASLGLQAVLAWAGKDPSPRLRTIRIVRDVTHEVKDKNWEGSKQCPACKGFKA